MRSEHIGNRRSELIAVRTRTRWVLALSLVFAAAACSSSGATPSPTASPVATATPGVTAVPSAEPVVTPTPNVAVADPTADMPGFVLTSPSFGTDGTIPEKYSCNGDDVSPALHWTGAPVGTKSFALIVDDPDAAGFVHWVVYNIDPGTTDLAEGVVLSGVAGQAMNGFGESAYGGPCPPSGTHRYVFTLYALSGTIALDKLASVDDARAAMRGTILGKTTLTATYTYPH